MCVCIYGQWAYMLIYVCIHTNTNTSRKAKDTHIHNHYYNLLFQPYLWRTVKEPPIVMNERVNRTSVQEKERHTKRDRERKGKINGGRWR